MTTVHDVMSSPVETVGPTTGFKEIAWLLRARRISALPVVDTSGTLLGVVSQTDLVLKEDRDGLEAERGLLGRRRSREALAKAAARTAWELMTSPAITIGPQAPVAQAARLMRLRGVKRLPVVDDQGRVIGIVSRGDLLAVFARPDVDIRREIVDGVIVRTLMLDPVPYTVIVEDGIVHLTGQADRRTDATLVERLARRVDGVVDVRSELTYRYDDGELRPVPPNEPLVYPVGLEGARIRNGERFGVQVPQPVGRVRAPDRAHPEDA